jgi:hypothetical protein
MTLFEDVRMELSKLGIDLRQGPAEYLLTHKTTPLDNPTRTLDLQDALASGREMAKNPPTLPETFGPLGNPRSRRALVRRHNRKLLKRRTQKKEAKVAAEVTEILKRDK